MNPAVSGLVAALGWGAADFIARFTSIALGHRAALFGMLSVGVVAFTGLAWWFDAWLTWHPLGFAYVVLSGLGVMIGTLLLYWALARGPVTVVSPIVGSYPAINLAAAILLGVRPSLLDWLAMAAVFAGVIIVARAAGSFVDEVLYSHGQIRRTIWISLGSALGFAVAVFTAQQATAFYDELGIVWASRCVSWLAIVLLMLLIRERPRIPVSWWPLVAVQGMLDGGAYLGLLLAGHGPGSEIAVVVASGFSAVTVLLARIFLREAMTLTQWAGIAAIVGGVATLST